MKQVSEFVPERLIPESRTDLKIKLQSYSKVNYIIKRNASKQSVGTGKVTLQLK
jgi:hypothetical protein